ncbi:hypothetical protein Pla8534_01560 [Lignipirellula cremea]|uniref:Uncharacterized protein n=1 Tax=Lignipirellula cremea TaxID=2528010 RepID=A0A518DKP1_9BACT|nr:hypothetical protein Pla8534_01560 [Lignipirellula cremea]
MKVNDERIAHRGPAANSDRQRQALGCRTLRELTTIVTPDTILRWHRELVAKKWDQSEKPKSVGRRRIREVIVDLIL